MFIKKSWFVSAASIVFGFLGVSAANAEDPAGDDENGLKLVGVIPNPGPNPLARADISYVDRRGERYYLADASNSAVDVFNAENGSLLGRITGFNGTSTGTLKTCGAREGQGPSGVLVTNDKKLWVTDSPGIVKIFDLEDAEPPFTTVTPIATISTGAMCRADELAFDPKDHVVIVGHPELLTLGGGTPFVTLISSVPPYATHNIYFPTAGGIEQSVWDRESHHFLLNVPGVGVAVIDPKTFTVKTYPTPGCSGTGLALGSQRHLLVGCGNGPALILNASDLYATPKIIPEVTGSDEVWFNPGDDRFYATSGFLPPGPPTLGVIDAATNTLLESVQTDFFSHSVAAFSENNHVFVPILWRGAPFQYDVCHVKFPALPAHQGCIFVFSRQE
ncbi:MAG: hypothetical protein M3O26_01325 [Pseudomonadota bacterium]|nr:hypothetical protein [Pseudomonadota bacterium]